MRTAPNATGIEEALGREVAITKHQRKRENIFAFDEEGAFFGEESFVGRQVHLRRVGLHLSEVGIDGEIERQVAGDTNLAVETTADVLPVTLRAEGILGILFETFGAGYHIRGKIKHPPGFDSVDAIEPPEL